MSLVATYVQANDGQWYANPVLRGKVEGRPWFIVYDDDDPIELVVNATTREEAERMKVEIGNLLKEHGCEMRPYSMSRFKPATKIIMEQRGGRLFGGANSKFKPAFRAWITIAAPPVKLITSHDGVWDSYPHRQGVYYPSPYHSRDGKEY